MEFVGLRVFVRERERVAGETAAAEEGMGAGRGAGAGPGGRGREGAGWGGRGVSVCGKGRFDAGTVSARDGARELVRAAVSLEPSWLGSAWGIWERSSYRGGARAEVPRH